jgi:hypothetical protein
LNVLSVCDQHLQHLYLGAEMILPMAQPAFPVPAFSVNGDVGNSQRERRQQRQ